MSFPNISPKAIAVGFCADVFSTKLFLLATTIVLLDPGSSSVAPIQRVDPDLLTWFCLAWGLLFTAVGGFIAARLAKREEMAHGMVVAWLSMMTSYHHGGWTLDAVGPVLWHIGLFGTVAAALAGAYSSRLVRR